MVSPKIRSDFLTVEAVMMNRIDTKQRWRAFDQKPKKKRCNHETLLLADLVFRSWLPVSQEGHLPVLYTRVELQQGDNKKRSGI